MIPITRSGGVTAGVTVDGGLAVSVGRPLAGGTLQAGIELRRGESPRWGIEWRMRF